MNGRSDMTLEPWAAMNRPPDAFSPSRRASRALITTWLWVEQRSEQSPATRRPRLARLPRPPPLRTVMDGLKAAVDLPALSGCREACLQRHAPSRRFPGP